MADAVLKIRIKMGYLHLQVCIYYTPISGVVTALALRKSVGLAPTFLVEQLDLAND